MWRLCILLLSTSLFSNDVTVNLRNPRYLNGILYSDEGGVINAESLRIQAKSIQYVNRNIEGKPVHRLEAEGDLMIQYKGRVYVGSELEYDFLTKDGTVYDGKTKAMFWYIGGDQILLQADGGYRVKNAFFTTCENQDSSWDIHAGRVNVFKEDLLEATKVRINFFKMLTFWLPSFKINLKKFKEPIFRYKFSWDKGQGPKASFRYQLYSWREFALYGRLEYRWATGFGGAIETDYATPNVTFNTRNYLGSDKLENAPDKQQRYRVQGALHSVSRSKKTQTVLTWDKYSDVRMPNDFKSDDFEVNTAKRTVFSVHHTEPNAIIACTVRPRVNPFDSIRQDLPTLYVAARPREVGNSGILYEFWSKASYLNFAYSTQLLEPLPNLHSTRLEVRPWLYRPIHFGSLTATPRIGGIGIFYGTSPSHQPKGLAALLYGGTLLATARRDFDTFRHQLQPYINYTGISDPTVSSSKHYIFSIQDGYQRLNQMQVGIRNSFFSKGGNASFNADLFANAFFKESAIPQVIPKLYLLLGCTLPSFELSFYNCWNFENQVLDFSNTRLRWTANENVAFALDFRYRSPYDWRKADHESFILDVYRTEPELLNSPLSDRRFTILSNLFVRLTPFWECHFQSHQGFLRKNNEPYTEFKIDLFTWISSSWKVRLSFDHTIFDDRVSCGLELIKKE